VNDAELVRVLGPRVQELLAEIEDLNKQLDICRAILAGVLARTAPELPPGAAADMLAFAAPFLPAKVIAGILANIPEGEA